MIKIEIVSETGGFVGLFKNVNNGLQSKLESFEREGWTIVSVVNENTAGFKNILRAIVAVCTLGIYSKQQGYVVILRK